MASALDGIRILDLTRVAPGSLCTMMLGDMGAEVIKIEQLPEPGARRAGSGISPMDEEGKERAAYYALNRNKKSVGLNLKSDGGREVFQRLAQTADVVVEGFRPGVMKRLGVDYRRVSRINPRIIYCSITGYGQDGPYQMLPGHDVNYIAMGGALNLIGPAEGPPVIPLNLVGDYAGGTLHAVIGILLALIAREHTGKGQQVDISMTDGVVSLLAAVISDYFFSGSVPKRGQDLLGGGAPCYNVYETKDGDYISLGCLEPWFWENLCRALGREDFIPHQWDDARRGGMLSYFREIFLTKPRDEWFEELRGKDIPVAKVYTLDEVFADPQVLHRQMMVEVEHPLKGKIKQVGIAIKLSDTPGKIRSLAPFFGEHTDEVLLGLGYSAKEIEELRQAGIIG